MMILLPILAICCWIRCVAPDPMATVAITEATPITIPSMVSAERSLFILNARNAMRMEERSCFIPAPLLQQAACQPRQVPPLVCDFATFASATIKPSRKRMMRPAYVAISSEWVTITIVIPFV